MSYRQYAPHPALAPYIDAYWQVKGPSSSLIMPDGCTDIIVNLGEDSAGVKYKGAYLVGTMLKALESETVAETHLFGIRFKPGAFTSFYRYAGLHEVTNHIIDFEAHLLPDYSALMKDFKGTMDNWLYQRLLPIKQPLTPFLQAITQSHGQISVEELAKKQCISVRQLERLFKQELGASPKAFIGFTRYRSAVQRLQMADEHTSLLEIAIHSGYYDHAHLSNEIKKHTGLTPSQLFCRISPNII